MLGFRSDEEFIKVWEGGNYYNAGEYLSIILQRLDHEIKKLNDGHDEKLKMLCEATQNDIESANKRINKLNTKLNLLLKQNKQKFRWVESHWELVDDE